jgi:UDP-N-acetylglucosamine diphosphorylase / glucose-1-phosphate thymidylyltransferase / UDP-N-acetylgalactosamine diphosphorylase / glucosamine-1-phosphate N-acetyltransferase / galactosamine-1-phosphate N-acetyltransferase
MQAVILAAGEGTRLRPFTQTRPKVMLPVGNRPILEFVVQSLVANGVRDIVMVVGYHKERIMSFFGDGAKFGARISYVVQERQLGTGHALTYLKGSVKGRFLLLPGDNIVDKETVAALMSVEKGSAVLVTESDEPSKYGVVELKDDRVIQIHEKPQESIGNIINTGLYNFESDVLPLIEHEVRQGNNGITQALKGVLQRTHLQAILVGGRWEDAVYPWDLVRLNEIALESHGQDINGTIESGVTIKGPVSIGKGTKIRSGCYIEGPVVIGEGCDIGPSVCIMPSTSIGDGTNIDPFCFIKNSIIMANVNIGSHCHICQSVIDDNVHIASNFASVCGDASVLIDKQWYAVEKIGCMVGEETSIGAGAVISAGSIIGSACRIGNGAKVSGNLDNRSIVI